ncbi:MAG: hypothetical protein IPK13_17035 [Deltaproteobacteria bacterium]|nr:hypothetical protein [Deltaproteobacteria bacterium]
MRTSCHSISTTTDTYFDTRFEFVERLRIDRRSMQDSLCVCGLTSPSWRI